jgi:hypothetical protein
VQRRGSLFGVESVVERRPVELHALFVLLLLDEERVDGRKKLGVFRLELVRAPQKMEGALGVAEFGEEVAGATREFRGGRFLGRDRVELPGVDLRQTRFGARRFREPLELRPGSLVGHVLVQQLRRGFERALVVLGLLFLQVGEPLQKGAAFVGVLARLEPRLDGGHELGEARPLLVDRLEHLRCARAMQRVSAVAEQCFELGDGRRMLAIVLERGLELVERAFDVGEVLPRDDRDLHEEIRAVLRFGLELAFVEGDEVLPAFLLSIEILEQGDRVGVERKIEDGLVDGDGGVGIAERRRAELSLPEKELLFLGIGIGGVDASLQDVEQRGTVARLFVQRFERRERALVVGPDVERLLVVSAGEIAVAELGARQLADAQARRELHVLVEDVRENLALERHEVGVVVGRGGETFGTFEPAGDLGFAGRFAHASNGVGKRARGVVLLRFGDARRLFEQAQANVGRVGRLGFDLENLEKLVVVGVGLVERVERLGGFAAGLADVEQLLDPCAAFRVGRVEGECLFERFERALPVVLVTTAHFAEPREELDTDGGFVG